MLLFMSPYIHRLTIRTVSFFVFPDRPVVLIKMSILSRFNKNHKYTLILVNHKLLFITYNRISISWKTVICITMESHCSILSIDIGSDLFREKKIQYCRAYSLSSRKYRQYNKIITVLGDNMTAVLKY
jgi:hypothetical protein